MTNANDYQLSPTPFYETSDPLELPKGKYSVVVRDYDGQRSTGGSYVLRIEYDDRGKVEKLKLEGDDKDTSGLERNLPFHKYYP